MQRGPQAVHLLSFVLRSRISLLLLGALTPSFAHSIQYRMHPNISAFPSTAFYQSRLTDGPNMDQKTLQPWHANALFPPYTFYHVDGREQAGRSHSWTNPTEAAMTLAIYQRLKREYASIDFDYRIGIVTPYKGQVGELRRTFRQQYGEEILTKISFNTVDVRLFCSSSFLFGC
jgi:senataxin